MKIISIVIATFNASSTLRRCIDSIALQKNNEIEIIIIDGASKDKTVDIIKSYGTTIDHFTSEADSGVYDAWNKGIKLSSAKWVMFLGADDQLILNSLESYLHLLKKNKNLNNIDYICAINEFVDKKENLLNIIGRAPEWMSMKKMMVAAHVGSLHNKKNLFDQVGLYNTRYKICADYELLLRKRNSLKFYFHQKKIARMAAGGMSFSFEAIFEAYKIRKESKSVSQTLNSFIFLVSIFAFYFFIIRKKILGFKF